MGVSLFKMINWVSRIHTVFYIIYCYVYNDKSLLIKYDSEWCSIDFYDVRPIEFIRILYNY